MKRQRITIADVAKAAGVAPITASLALNRSPKVLESTIQSVAEAARKLGYRTLRERRLQENQSGTGAEVWGLIFPYYIKEYSYTKLDLQIIDSLEAAAQENHAVLQISRLNENLDLQSNIDVANFSHVFIKSHCNIGKINALKQRGCRSVILFGFNDNIADGLQVSYNQRSAVALIVEKAVEIGCSEIIHIDSERNGEQTFLNAENRELLVRFADKAGLRRHHVFGTPDEIVRQVRELVKAASGKVALAGLRDSGSGVEQQCMERVLQSGIRAGTDVECFACEYERSEMKHPGFFYVDLLGKDIIRQAVCLSKLDASSHTGLFQLEPTLFHISQ